ncbi:ElaD/SseL family deubiquitinase [Pleionea sp. CnH1-48]|uniref:ElaD/SseL family deubiquitinase n=1 Tax=Pleionea sp. CnH1-48 TaxID=2954494 RepID=UPI002096B235|nr:ElaD/SseL family deubiquitinase [Pleionea sp. CnH1-48]MCO7223012.1 ElaD/SseL family deubiquitinase [Pleionea sp. CnH1-48]
MQVSQIYGISQQSFDELFGAPENISPKAFTELKESAKSGNVNSIDLLQNMALRNDYMGFAAEQALYDVYTGEAYLSCDEAIDNEYIAKEVHDSIRDDIQSSSLKMFELMESPEFKQNNENNRLPKSVLYMASKEVSSGSETHQQINETLTESLGLQSQNVYEQVGKDDFSCNGRFVTHDELDERTKDMSSIFDNISINSPISLIDPQTKSNQLADILFEKSQTQGNQFLDKPEVFPINVGNHWILCVASKDENGEIELTAFDSKPSSNRLAMAELKERLQDVSDSIGGQKGIIYIEKDLQSHVPNGCGLFVSAAIDELGVHYDEEKSPSDVLKSMVDDFQTYSKEEMETFNREQREELLKGIFFSDNEQF